MDLRTGDLYASLAAGRAAGVPDDVLVEVTAFGGDEAVDPALIRITSGPFKGRVYQRTGKGLVRIRHLESSKR